MGDRNSDHGLRPWFGPLLQGFHIKRRDWTSLGFWAEIRGSQEVGVDPVLVKNGGGFVRGGGGGNLNNWCRARVLVAIVNFASNPVKIFELL